MVDGSMETDIDNQIEHSHPPILKAHPWLVFLNGAYKGVKTLVSRRKGKKTQRMENSNMAIAVENQLEIENRSMEINVENQLKHSRPPNLGLHPWLVFSHGVGGRIQTFFSISEGHSYVRSIPDMTNKYCCTCSHGWLVMLDVDSDECFLLNPVSLEKIQLPPLKFYTWYFCVLSSAPNDPNGCFVVFFDSNCLMYCQPCHGEWVMEELEYQISCAIGFEGKIYALKTDVRNNIILFKVNLGSGMRILRQELTLPSLPKRPSCGKYFMVESCGEVFVVKQACWQLYNPRVRYFEIFKFNLTTTYWEKVETLGDRAFFIDTVKFYCLSCLATESGIKKNSIYFTEGGKGLYIFDVELKHISISLPCPDVGSEGLEVSWIMFASTISCPLSYDEGKANRIKYEEENTLAIVENTIPTIRKIVEEEIKHEGGKTFAIMENIVPTIRNTMEGVIDVQQLPCSWADLPQDLLSLIQSCLFAGDRICFRAVCREWQCSQAQLPLDSMDYSMMASSPCLMFSAMNNCNINLFYPMYNHTCTLKLQEELSGENICFSKDGWLLLVQSDLNMFFLNPFTNARIEIAYFPLGFNFDAVCFTSTPTSSDCIVFGIVSSGLYEVDIFVLHPREERWTVYNLENRKRWGVCNCIHNSTSFSPSQSNPVFYGGLFYCLDEEGKLGCFDPKGGSWTVFKTSWKLCVSKYDQNFLVECDGNLLSVFVGPLGRWIQVCRLDQSKMLWKNVNSLGDWMLFLSEKTSFSAKAVVRGMGNKIYIQRFFANLGVFYSLDTQRYHTFDGGYCGKNFYGTTEEIQCTWMMI